MRPMKIAVKSSSDLRRSPSVNKAAIGNAPRTLAGEGLRRLRQRERRERQHHERHDPGIEQQCGCQPVLGTRRATASP